MKEKISEKFLIKCLAYSRSQWMCADLYLTKCEIVEMLGRDSSSHPGGQTKALGSLPSVINQKDCTMWDFPKTFSV